MARQLELRSGREAAVRALNSVAEHGVKVWPSHRKLMATREIRSKRSTLATPARMEKTRCSLIRLQRIPPDGKTLVLETFLKMPARAEGFAP